MKMLIKESCRAAVMGAMFLMFLPTIGFVLTIYAVVKHTRDALKSR